MNNPFLAQDLKKATFSFKNDEEKIRQRVNKMPSLYMVTYDWPTVWPELEKGRKAKPKTKVHFKSYYLHINEL